MPGAIYQLKAKGPQDQFLTSKPQVNFINKIYKQYTNFSIEPIRLDFNDDVDFGRSSKITIKHKGDLLSKIYLKFSLPKLNKTSGEYAGWTNSIGHSIIKYVDIQIGGHTIDRHYGIFMEIWNELTCINNNYDQLIGKYHHVSLLTQNALKDSTYYIPLQFWFCKTLGTSFPLISLHSHEISIIFKFRPFEECIVYDGVTPPSRVSLYAPELIADYVFLDDPERKIISNKEHKILIEQIQTLDGHELGSEGTVNASLNFNHPCKELLWVLIEKESEANNDWFNFSLRNPIVFSKIDSLMSKAKLILDGQDRSIMHNYKLYSLVNSSRYHTNTVDKHIFCMPFCDKPENWQPTGTLNFSAIDDAILQINLSGNSSGSINLYVFAINYNLLYIKNGMCSVAYHS